MKKFFVLVAILGSLGFFSGISAVGYVVYDVFLGDYSHLSKERILEILSKETIVYFDDGMSQVGSLFGDEHRQYVPIRDTPESLKKAIIAAEDDSYFKHVGVDFVSTLRAALVNIIFNRREGASTITQQTVKNLYGRPVTNLRAKYAEAINAFKIERLYTKDEILEFYLNQFHVTGNGRGIGVAAKYYFNKDVQDLTLVESAFIAGSVKGPELYNPFTKKSLQARERALQRASDRKNYVIGRMAELGHLTPSEKDKALAARIPFSQGRFQFNQLSAIDLIKGQLSRQDVLQALGVEKVDQIASMGLKVTTTLNQEIQDYAQYGVRQNLSRLSMVLRGFRLAENRALRNFSQLIPREFYTGKVLSIDQTKGKENLDVSLGLAHCIVPADGVERVAKFLDHGRYKGLDHAKKGLFDLITPGAAVMVSVRKEIQTENSDAQSAVTAEAIPEAIPDAPFETTVAPAHDQGETGALEGAARYYECDLEVKPEINGAAIAIDKGEILSVVGGFSPHEYNRAVYARRQPGSTFKTLTYYAALHLGWSALDPLVNVRDAYVWQGKFYYPRPDHPPKTLTTTIVGAEAASENLASVWLLAHLTKKLSPSQFNELLVSLEAIDGTETETALASKLRDKFNVTFAPADLAEGVVDSIIDEYSQDLTVVANRELYMNLVTLNYGGPRYDREIGNFLKMREKSLNRTEREARKNMLLNNLTRWSSLQQEFERDFEIVKEQISKGNYFFRSAVLDRFRMTKTGKFVYFGENQRFEPAAFSKLIQPIELAFLSSDELLMKLELHLKEHFQDSSPELAHDIWLDGYMPASMVKEMARVFAERLDKVSALPLSERMFWNWDLRYSAGMLFSKNLVDDMGVLSKTSWVPSFPLGTNDVSLAELAMSYQTLLLGQTYQFFDDEAVNQLSLVKRIEDAQGNLLWEAQRESRQVFDAFYSSSILSALKGTVTNGTARVASSNLLVDGGAEDAQDELKKARLKVPAFGKTGTTNDYVNATFVGFLPYPVAEGTTELSAEHAITIASYVGFDNNKPMRRPGVRIAGGTGALPAWIEIAKAIIREKDYSELIDWKTLVKNKEPEVIFDYGQTQEITVPLHSSVVLASNEQGVKEGQGEVADLNVFHDDYADSSEDIVTVHLPGNIEHGVFNPRTRVQFPKSKVKEFLPETIPELNLNEGNEVSEDGEGVEGGEGNEGGEATGVGDQASQEESAQSSEVSADTRSSVPPRPDRYASGSGSEEKNASSGARKESVIPERPSREQPQSQQGAAPQQDAEGFNFLIPPPPVEMDK